MFAYTHGRARKGQAPKTHIAFLPVAQNVGRTAPQTGRYIISFKSNSSNNSNLKWRVEIRIIPRRKKFNWFSWKIKLSQWLYFLFLLLLMCVQHFQEESFLSRKVSKCLGLLAVRTFGGQPGIWLKKLSLSFSNQEWCLSTPSVSIDLWRRSPLSGIRTPELLFNTS